MPDFRSNLTRVFARSTEHDKSIGMNWYEQAFLKAACQGKIAERERRVAELERLGVSAK